MKKSKRNVFLKECILFIMLALIVLPSMQVEAKQEQRVRVGWFQQPGYQEVEAQGQPYGYNYEYFMQIAQHTGWNYEFVETDSFETAYQMLQNGQLDMLGCVIYTKERGETLGIPRISSGNVFTSLFVEKNSTIAPHDVLAFDGLKVGCRESQNPVDLLTYAKENGFSVELFYYKSVSEIEEAVLKKEVDAGVVGGYQTSKDTRIVASFAPNQFYFVCNKEKTELLQALNRALDTIQIENPFYEKELAYKYLPEIRDSLRLTKEEQEYIKKQEKLRVVYQKDGAPLSDMDLKTGVFTGICADVFKRISEISGLEFLYVETDNIKGANEDELIASLMSDFLFADKVGYKLTKSYLSIPLVTVWNTSNKNSKGDSTAVSYSFSRQEKVTRLGEESIDLYETEEECLEAVRLGKAKRAYVNAYTVEKILAKKGYGTLETAPMYGVSCELSIAVREDLDPVLCSILNKSLEQISASEMNAIILKNTAKENKITLKTIIEQMPTDVILLAVFLLTLVVIILVLLLHARTKNVNKIKKLLYIDELTGILSLKGFEFEVRKLLKENQTNLYFIVDFDINCFEEFNTINGYEAGDKILKQIADFTKEVKEKDEISARIQADHFICMIKGETLESIIKRVQGANKQLQLRTKIPALLISYGIYEIKNRTMDIASMRDCALQAKRTIKGNYDRFIAIYDDKLHRKQLNNIEIVGKFEKALQEGELVPYFQPQYDAKTQEIIGAEALVRWFPATGGMIPPDYFIGLLEKNGLIWKLDLFMFEQACRKIAVWIKEGREILSLSVNISQAHLYNPNFLDNLMEIVGRYQVPTKNIVIELTETAFLDNQHELISIVDKLHKEGFLVAMDDFGSGYSSLNMLKDLPFDVMKIDRGFLSSTSGSKKGETVIQNILTLARDLKLHTVAEGVEEKEQFDFLKKNGCDVIQGYYFSKPISEEEFEEKIKKK